MRRTILKGLLFLFMLMPLMVIGQKVPAGRCDVKISSDFESSCLLTEYYKADSTLLLPDSATCYAACKGNKVVYTATVSNAAILDWQIEGAENYTVSSDSLSVEVLWGDEERGSVTASAVGLQGDTCMQTLCVLLVDPPVVGSVTVPSFYIDPSGLKIIEICLGETIVLTDESSASTSALTGFLWDTPYGQYTTRNCSIVPTQEGRFIILHEVQNECGCTSSEEIEVVVAAKSDLELSCYGTVCAGSTATYTVLKPDCKNYHWSVKHGYIVSGQDTPTVTVQWGDSPSGYGVISIDGAPCNMKCDALLSKRIPIISPDVAIVGPDTLCLGDVQLYELPLWGSTDYSWSYTPSVGVRRIPYEAPNQFLAEFSQPGVYWMAADYECGFIGCGPYTSALKTVVVLDTLAIHAPTDVCLNEMVALALNVPGVQARWTVRDNDGVLLCDTITDTLRYKFPLTGNVSVSAYHKDYCKPAVCGITVHDNPPPMHLSDTSALMACGNSSLLLGDTPTSRRYYLKWVPMCDTANFFEGDTVSVHFSDTACPLLVYQVDRVYGCISTPDTKAVTPFRLLPVNHNIIDVHAGCTVKMSVPDQSDNVEYEWSIQYTQFASFVGSNTGSTVVVRGNHIPNYPYNFSIRVTIKRTYCGSYQQLDTMFLNILYPDSIRIVGLQNVCQGSVISMQATGTYGYNYHYRWKWAEAPLGLDGFFETSSVNWPCNNPGWQHFWVERWKNPYSCDTIIRFDSFYVSPLPTAMISKIGNTLYVADQQNVVYHWYKDGSLLPSTGPTCPLTGLGTYCCHVQSQYGLHCEDSMCYTHGPEAISTCDTLHVDAFVNIPDSSILVTVLDPNATNITFFIAPFAQGQYINYFTRKFKCSQPGAYLIEVSAMINGECRKAQIRKVLPYIINMSYSYDCDSTITVYDNSLYLPNIEMPVRILKNIFTRYDTLTGHQTMGCIKANLPGYNQIVMQFIDTVNMVNCTIKKDFHIPPFPTIDMVEYPSNVCDGTPFNLSIEASNANNVLWTFDDGSRGYNRSLEHTYNYDNSPLAFNTHTIIATAYNSIGCSTNTSFNTRVNPNPLSSSQLLLIDTTLLCPGSADTILFPIWNSGYTYIWIDHLLSDTLQIPSSSYEAYHTGNYSVRVETPIGCVKEAMLNVPFLTAPVAFIDGDTVFCQGDEIRLNGFTGDGFTYHWRITDRVNYTRTFDEGNIRFTADTAGFFTAYLEVSSDNECPAFATHHFIVHPQPPAPSVAFGNPCINNPPVELHSTSGGPLYWSNGYHGSSAFYYSDGFATAHYYDATTGCKSKEAEIFIHPQPNYDALLTGCYTKCPDALATSIPVYGFYPYQSDMLHWNWMHDGSALHSGSEYSIAALPIPDFGGYQLITKFGLGCMSESPALTIEPKDTCSCDSIRVVVRNVNCKAEGCELYYDFDVEICNHGGTALFNRMTTVTNDMITSVTPWPITLMHDSCQTVHVTMQRNTFGNSMLTLTIFDPESNCKKSFGVPYGDMDCITTDCHLDLGDWFAVDELCTLHQTSYFRVMLHPDMGINSLLGFWSEPGQMIDFFFDGDHIDGLYMADYGRLTQMAADGGEICFHAIVCTENKELCHAVLCLSAEELLNILPQDGKGGHGGVVSDTTQHSLPLSVFDLVPNPATDKVSVVGVGGVAEITVFDMFGRVVGTYRDVSVFSVSALAKDSYIVKVVTADGHVEYRKLIKQ